MKILFGQKIGMTQLWNESGRLVGVTVIRQLPNKVIKQNNQKVAVSAVNGRAAKPQDYLAKAVDSKRGVWVQGLPSEEELPESLTVDQFEAGQTVAVLGVTKGKGFSGTIKRHNFRRGPVSHGSDNVRQPGSIGAQRPQRVIKGKKMAGRMGGKKLTVRGNKVVAIDKDQGLLIVSGPVPGPNKSYLTVKGIEND